MSFNLDNMQYERRQHLNNSHKTQLNILDPQDCLMKIKHRNKN